jgi:hypothetical protein
LASLGYPTDGKGLTLDLAADAVSRLRHLSGAAPGVDRLVGNEDRER